MPKPRSPKEIKQFLGLTGYYRNFSPRFSNISRPLTKLLAHDCEFKWNNQCDPTFQILKNVLCSAPVLKYPDTYKPYTPYTDASKYSWAGCTHPNAHLYGGLKRSYNGSHSFICEWLTSW